MNGHEKHCLAGIVENGECSCDPPRRPEWCRAAKNETCLTPTCSCSDYADHSDDCRGCPDCGEPETARAVAAVIASRAAVRWDEAVADLADSFPSQAVSPIADYAARVETLASAILERTAEVGLNHWQALAAARAVIDSGERAYEALRRAEAEMMEFEAEYEIEHNMGCEGEPDCPKCVLIDCIRVVREAGAK